MTFIYKLCITTCILIHFLNILILFKFISGSFNLFVLLTNDSVNFIVANWKDGLMISNKNAEHTINNNIKKISSNNSKILIEEVD
jgi:hypothetical protein